MVRLIDSSALITLERRGIAPDSIDRFVPAESAVIASITASELLAGVYRAPRSDRRRTREAFVETILSLLPVLPFDLSAARIHAKLLSDFATAGQPIDTHDVMIAAIALVHGYSVLTENVRHFARVPGLAVDRPAW